MKLLKAMTMGAVILTVATSMSACGTNSSNTSSNSGQAGASNTDSAKSGKPVEITFANWLSVDDTTKEAYNQLIADFEKKHPNIKVKSIGIPFAQFKDQVLVSSAGGNAPDVAMSNQNFTSAFVGAKVAAPVQDLVGADLVNDIVDGSRKGVTFDSKVMAVPWAPHPSALFWNKTLFKKAGLDPEKPPQTWDEMIEDAKKIAALGKNEKGNPVYGIGENGASDSYTGNMLLRINLSYGGKFVDDQGNVTYDQGTALKDSLNYMKDMINNKISPKGSLMTDLRPMFANGALGMIVDGDFGRTFYRTMSGKGEAFDKEWGVATVPQGKTGRSETVFTEHQLVIADQGKHKAEAVFICSLKTFA